MGEIRVQSQKLGAAIGKAVFGTMAGLSGCNIHFLASGKEFSKKSVLAKSNVHAKVMVNPMYVQEPLLDRGMQYPVARSAQNPAFGDGFSPVLTTLFVMIVR
jgi:hypothetical protein